MKTRNTRNQKGFSLIEVVIAMGVLAFGLLVLAAAQIHAIGGGRSGRHVTHAMSIAQSQMEQLQRMRWTNLAPTAWTGGVAVNNTIGGATQTGNEQAYVVQWRITDVVATRLRNVDVRVNWTEPKKGARSYTLSSARYNFEGL